MGQDEIRKMKKKPTITTGDLQILINSASNDIEYVDPSPYTKKVERCIARVEAAIGACISLKASRTLKRMKSCGKRND
jgi:hypothetical protein